MAVFYPPISYKYRRRAFALSRVSPPFSVPFGANWLQQMADGLHTKRFVLTAPPVAGRETKPKTALLHSQLSLEKRVDWTFVGFLENISSLKRKTSSVLNQMVETPKYLFPGVDCWSSYCSCAWTHAPRCGNKRHGFFFFTQVFYPTRWNIFKTVQSLFFKLQSLPWPGWICENLHRHLQAHRSANTHLSLNGSKMNAFIFYWKPKCDLF